MKNRSEFASKVNELGKWTLHAVLWHLWHAPANALRVLWFAPRGLWRVVASIWGWVFDAEARSLRQDAIAMKSHEDHYKHAKLLQERVNQRLKVFGVLTGLSPRSRPFGKSASRSGTNSTTPSNALTPAERSFTGHLSCWTTARPCTNRATRP